MEEENHSWNPPPPQGYNAADVPSFDRSQVIRSLILLLPKQYRYVEDLQNLDERMLESLQTQLSRLGQDEKENKEDEQQIEACCFLWDLSALPEHAAHLAEFHAVAILVNLLRDDREPPPSNRLREVAMGTLANMCSLEGVRKELIQRPDTQRLLEFHLYSISDTPSLCELTRLLLVCYSSDDSVHFFDSILGSEDSLKRLLFLLRSSLNDNLRLQLATLFHYLLFQSSRAVSVLLESDEMSNILELLQSSVPGDNMTNDSPSGEVSDMIMRLLEVCTLRPEFYSYLKEHEEEGKRLVNILMSAILASAGESSSTAAIVLANISLEAPNIVQPAIRADHVKGLLDMLPIDDNEVEAAVWNLLQASVPDSGDEQTMKTLADIFVNNIDQMIHQTGHSPEQGKKLLALSSLRVIQTHIQKFSQDPKVQTLEKFLNTSTTKHPRKESC